MADIENQKSPVKRVSIISKNDKMNEDIRLSQKSLNYDENEQNVDQEKGGDEEDQPLIGGYKSERSIEKKKKRKSRRSTKGQPKQLSSEKQEQNAETELEEKACGIIEEENWELLEI